MKMYLYINMVNQCKCLAALLLESFIWHRSNLTVCRGPCSQEVNVGKINLILESSADHMNAATGITDSSSCVISTVAVEVVKFLIYHHLPCPIPGVSPPPRLPVPALMVFPWFFQFRVALVLLGYVFRFMLPLLVLCLYL